MAGRGRTSPRLPIPAEKPPDMEYSQWCKIKKRGWYCPMHKGRGLSPRLPHLTSSPGPKRRVFYTGPDYASLVIHDMTSFCRWTLTGVLRQHHLSWEWIALQNPGLEREDLVQDGVVRILELRSDERGKDNWKFYAKAASSAQMHVLRSLQRHSVSRVHRLTELI